MASNILFKKLGVSGDSSSTSARTTPPADSPYSTTSTTPSTADSSVATAFSVTSAPSVVSSTRYETKKEDPNTTYALYNTDNATTNPSPLGPGTTSDQLIQLTCDYISALNNRAWSVAESLQVSFHPAYITECRFTNREQTFLDSLASIRGLARGFPDFRCRLVEASGKVEEDGKTAYCFFHTEWLDCPPEITTTAMYAIEWRFVDGMWLCWRTNVLRGVDEVV